MIIYNYWKRNIAKNKIKWNKMNANRWHGFLVCLVVILQPPLKLMTLMSLAQTFVSLYFGRCYILCFVIKYMV